MCDCCSSYAVKLINEAEICTIPRRRWPLIYYCVNCRARVGCHPGTAFPLGFMANGYIRRLRATLHETLDPLWRSGLATRTEIYSWLAKELSVSFDFCHVSQLSEPQLLIALKLATKYRDLNSERIAKAYRDKQWYKRNRS